MTHPQEGYSERAGLTNFPTYSSHIEVPAAQHRELRSSPGGPRPTWLIESQMPSPSLRNPDHPFNIAITPQQIHRFRALDAFGPCLLEAASRSSVPP